MAVDRELRSRMFESALDRSAHIEVRVHWAPLVLKWQNSSRNQLNG